MATTLKKRIMRRVYTIWFIRKAVPLGAELAVLGIAVVWGLQHTSPANILTNSISASNNMYAFMMFFIRSFSILTPPAQFALVITGLLGAFIARDIWTQAGHLSDARNKMLFSINA